MWLKSWPEAYFCACSLFPLLQYSAIRCKHLLVVNLKSEIFNLLSVNMTDMLFRWSLYLITFKNHSLYIMSSYSEIIYVNSINIYSDLITTVKSKCKALNLNIKALFKGIWSEKTYIKIINYIKQKICVCSHLNSTWHYSNLYIDRVNE